MDTPLARVTRRAMRNGDPGHKNVPVPLLSLEEFFEGNDEVGSIGCNLTSEPGPGEFYDLLRNIRLKLEVSDIRIQITCVDRPGEDWPFSDTIWFVTTAEPERVRDWFPEHLAPDEIWEGWNRGVTYDPCSIPAGQRVIAAWYD